MIEDSLHESRGLTAGALRCNAVAGPLDHRDERHCVMTELTAFPVAMSSSQTEDFSFFNSPLTT